MSARTVACSQGERKYCSCLQWQQVYCDDTLNQLVCQTLFVLSFFVCSGKSEGRQLWQDCRTCMFYTQRFCATWSFRTACESSRKLQLNIHRWSWICLEAQKLYLPLSTCYLTLSAVEIEHHSWVWITRRGKCKSYVCNGFNFLSIFLRQEIKCLRNFKRRFSFSPRPSWRFHTKFQDSEAR